MVETPSAVLGSQALQVSPSLTLARYSQTPSLPLNHLSVSLSLPFFLQRRTKTLKPGCFKKLREWRRKKRRGTNLKLLFSGRLLSGSAKQRHQNMVCGEPCWVAVLVLKLPGLEVMIMSC
jgi:hypothetical protein